MPFSKRSMTWHQREKMSSWFRSTLAAVSSNAFGSSTLTPIFSSHARDLENRSNCIATPSVVRMCASPRRT